MASVDPNAKRMVWMGDLKVFAETFKVGELNRIPSEEGAVLKKSSVGPIGWDPAKGYWVNITSEEADMKSRSPKKKVKFISKVTTI